jgi:hypothetical protein
LPPAFSKGLDEVLTANLPQGGPQVLGTDLNCSERISFTP